MHNALVRAQRIAFFGAVEASSQLAQARASRRTPAVDPWVTIRQDRRNAYLAGEGRIGEARLGQLMAEFPECAKVWRARVWEFLNPDLNDRSCETRLYEECEATRSTVALQTLLDRAAENPKSYLPQGLDEVSFLVLAFRVAKHSASPRYAMKIAAALAKALLLLAGCPYRQAASEQVWRYVGHMFVRGLKDRSHSVSFDIGTWGFVLDHAVVLRAHFTTLAYAQETYPPFVVMEEMLRDVVTALVTEDEGFVTLVNARFNLMSLGRRLRFTRPDFGRLSIWRSLGS